MVETVANMLIISELDLAAQCNLLVDVRNAVTTKQPTRHRIINTFI